MLGNVSEWVQDLYGRLIINKTYDINIQESIDTINPRLLRGGTFVNLPADVRSAYRLRLLAPASRIISIGFRPSRTYH